MSLPERPDDKAPSIFLTKWYDKEVHEYTGFESIDLDQLRQEIEVFDDTNMELISIEEIPIE